MSTGHIILEVLFHLQNRNPVALVSFCQVYKKSLKWGFHSGLLPFCFFFSCHLESLKIFKNLFSYS